MRTVITAVLVLAVCAPTALARKWTDSTAKYTVEAELVRFEDGKVQLRKADGTVVTVPIEKLSESDLAIGFAVIASAGPVPWDTGTTVIIWSAVAIVGLILFSNANKPPPRNRDSGVRTNEIP